MKNFYSSSYVIPFGKHKGKTIDQVAKTDDGLCYLDWAAGQWNGVAGDQVRAYVKDPVIKREIQEALEARNG